MILRLCHSFALGQSTQQSPTACSYQTLIIPLTSVILCYCAALCSKPGPVVEVTSSFSRTLESCVEVLSLADFVLV